MQEAGNGIGRWLLGLAAGIVALVVSVYGFDLGLLSALAIGIAVALVVWLLVGRIWGPTEPVFVMEKPRVRKIMVGLAALDAEPEPAKPAPAPAMRVPIARVPAAPVAEAVGQSADAATKAKDHAEFYDQPEVPVVRPRAVVRPRLEVQPEAEPKRKSPAKPKAVAKPKAAARSRAEVVPRAEVAEKPAPKPRAARVKPEGPVRLKAPRKGRADDLKAIQGIGPTMEKLLNGLGFYHFDQIGSWSDTDVALVDAEMKTFKGRATRDRWVVQAKILAAGGTVEEAEAAARA